MSENEFVQPQNAEFSAQNANFDPQNQAQLLEPMTEQNFDPNQVQNFEQNPELNAEQIAQPNLMQEYEPQVNKETLEMRLHQLNQIVQTLENSNLSIDDAIQTYADGMRLAVSCRQSLNEMSQKVEQVRQETMRAMNQLSSKEYIN